MRVLRYPLVSLLCLTLAVTTLQAQVEVGTRAGMGLVLPDEGSILAFGVPGGAPSPVGTLLGTAASAHLAFFPGGKVMVEPQLTFQLLSISNGDTETLTSIGVTGTVAYLFSSAEVASPYLGFQASFFTVSDGDDSENDFAVGGALGYRFLPAENVALRLEGAYRRWFDFELNEINVAFILGVLFD